MGNEREEAAEQRKQCGAPCDCVFMIDGKWAHDCGCGNSGDLDRVATWCAEVNGAEDLTRLRAELEEAKADAKTHGDAATYWMDGAKRLEAKLAAAEAAREMMEARMEWTVTDNAKKAVALEDLKHSLAEAEAARDTHKARADAACELLREPELVGENPDGTPEFYTDEAELDWLARRDAFLASPGASGGECEHGDFGNMAFHLTPDQAYGVCGKCREIVPVKEAPSEGGAR